ncbi:N-acetylglucosamine-6-phosphate deacetylase [Cyanobium sp. PCC 7001]|nr:N-acetylglucosamine-6-phosphate deacetylase [Cyanobium sp. PCC 7001]
MAQEDRILSPAAAMRWIRNLRLPRASRCGHGADRRWRLAVGEEGLIDAAEPLDPGSAAAGEDWQGDWLSPAGVDLQINGGLGLAFPELTADDLPRLLELLELLWRDGVEAICPTLVTCGIAPLRTALALDGGGRPGDPADRPAGAHRRGGAAAVRPELRHQLLPARGRR